MRGSAAEGLPAAIDEHQDCGLREEQRFDNAIQAAAGRDDWRHGVWDEMARLDRARRSSRCKSFAVISTYGIVIPGSTPEEIRGQSTKSFALWTKSDTGQATDGTEVFSVSRAKGKTRLHSCGCDQSIG